MPKTIHKSYSLLGVFVIFAFLSGCTQKVLVPPRVELNAYGVTGIFQFSCNAQGDLGRFATQKFMEFVQSYQPGTPIIELGPLHRAPDPQFLQEIKKQSGVDAVIVGDVDVSQVKPDINFSSFMTAMKVRANVEASLMVKLYDTKQGATLWTRSSYANETVAQVGLSKSGRAYFEASDPEKAYGSLVHALIERATYDFRPRWVRKK